MTNTARNNVPEVTLGWRMRMAMEHAGIKRDEMAVRMGVRPGTITRWTHDIGAAPRAIYLERWAELTEVPLEWIRGSEAPDTNSGTGRDSLRNRHVLIAA